MRKQKESFWDVFKKIIEATVISLVGSLIISISDNELVGFHSSVFFLCCLYLLIIGFIKLISICVFGTSPRMLLFEIVGLFLVGVFFFYGMLKVSSFYVIFFGGSMIAQLGNIFVFREGSLSSVFSALGYIVVGLVFILEELKKFFREHE